MRPHPLVSVILPAYNSEPFLRETLQSILTQDYGHLELIVIDDTSTDNTWRILRSIPDPRLRLYRNRNNRGISLARNRGLRLARGKYIAFFDHDDVMLPGAISKRVRCLENEGANVVFGYTRDIIDKNGKSLIGARNEWLTSLLKLFRLTRIIDLKPLRPFLSINLPMLTDLVLRKTTALRTGYFDPSLKTSEDCDYVCRIAKGNLFHFVDAPVKLYRIHGGNIMLRTPRRETDRSARKVARRHGIPLSPHSGQHAR